MRKDQPDVVQWTTTIEKAYNTPKGTLTHDTVMRSPDYSKTFVLQMEASKVGVGAVLSQPRAQIFRGGAGMSGHNTAIKAEEASKTTKDHFQVT